MRRALIVLAIVLALPAAMLTYFAFVGGVILIVHNTGKNAIQYSAVIEDGNLADHVTAKAVGAGSLGWMIFTPKLEGGLVLQCKSANGFSKYELGYVTPGASVYWNIELNSCDGMKKRAERFL